MWTCFSSIPKVSAIVHAVWTTPWEASWMCSLLPFPVQGHGMQFDGVVVVRRGAIDGVHFIGRSSERLFGVADLNLGGLPHDIRGRMRFVLRVLKDGGGGFLGVSGANE